MKIKSKTILNIICITGIFLFMLSCSKMNDDVNIYLEKGEDIYAAKVDSVSEHSGYQRLQLEIFVKAQRIQSLWIYWNDYLDSCNVEVNNKTGVFKKTIENMVAQSYVFNLVSIDIDGNRSLPFETTGIVYGDAYISKLNNRSVETPVLSTNGVAELIWRNQSYSGALSSDVIYTDKEGNEKKVFVPIDESTTILENCDPDAGFKYTTSYLPDSLALDTFDTECSEIIPIYNMIDRSDWTVTADNYEHTGQLPNGPPEKVLDGDIDTYWHTQHVGGSPGFPHWLAFDMKKQISVKIALVMSRWNYLTSDATEFIIQKSDDGVTWTDCQTYDLPNVAGYLWFTLDEPIITRYIRYYQTKGASPYGQLSEFAVVGSEVE